MGDINENSESDNMQKEDIKPKLANFRRINGTCIYRASRTDNLDDENIHILNKNFQIKTLINLRNATEIKGTGNIDINDGQIHWTVDKYYKRFTVTTSRDGNLTYSIGVLGEGESYGNHYVLDVISNVLRHNIMSCPLWLKMKILFAYAGDRMFGTSNVPALLFPYLNEDLIDLYKNMIKFSGNVLAAALDLLTEPSNVPALIMCAYGKDRTGILAALIQGCCGVDDHTIATDYAKSEEELREVMDDIKATMKKYYLNDSFSEAKYDVMIQLLEFIKEEYGGIPEYMESIGFTKDKQEALRKNVMLS